MRRRPRAAAASAAVVLGLLVACTSESGSADAPTGSPSTAPSPAVTADAPSTELIAFSTMQRGQVVVTPPDGKGRQVLVSGSGCCSALSPDGTRLLYLTQTSDGGEAAATMRTDGTDRQLIPPVGGLDLVPGTWTADGTHMLFGGVDEGALGRNGVFITDGHGSQPRRLTRTSGSEFDLPVDASPDGRLVLFMRVPNSEADPFKGDLYVVPVTGGEPVRLNPSGTVVGYVFVGPGNFFPDSRRVAYVALPADLDAPETGAVMVVGVDGSASRRLTPPTLWTTSAHVSPDGQWITFDRPRSDRDVNEVYLMHPDGSGLHRLESAALGSCCAIWSPDSTRLLFSRGGSSATNLGWARIDGGDTHELTTAGGEIFTDYSWAGGLGP